MTTLKTTKFLVSRFVKPILIYQKKNNKKYSIPNPSRHSACTVFRCATNCAEMLRSWKRSYMDTRAQIERSGIGSRWEFDRNVLFRDVDHMTRISQDTANVAKVRYQTSPNVFFFLTSCKIIWQVFLEFEAMFDHHLKTMISDPEEVDNILKKVRTLCLDFRSFEGS